MQSLREEILSLLRVSVLMSFIAENPRSQSLDDAGKARMRSMTSKILGHFVLNLLFTSHQLIPDLCFRRSLKERKENYASAFYNLTYYWFSKQLG